jgi:MFS family permease
VNASPTIAPNPNPGFFAIFGALPVAVRKNLTVLLSAQALSTGAVTVSTSLSSIIVEDLTGNAALSGLPSTINFFASAFAAYWFGRLMAARGRRVGLALGCAIGAIGAIIAAWMALHQNFYGFLAGGLLVGVCNGAMSQNRYAAGEMVSKAVRGRVMGSLLTGSVLGTVLSYAITPLFHSLAKSYALPPIEFGWYLGGAFLALASVLIWVFLRPDPKALAASEDGSVAIPIPISSALVDNASSLPARAWLDLLRNPGVRLAMLSLTFGQGLMVMLMVLTPLHAKHLGLEPTILVTEHIVGMFGFAWLTGQLVDTWGRRTVVMIGAAQTIVAGFVAYFATRSLELGFSMFMVGLGWNFLNVAGSALLTDHLEPHERARIQGGSELAVWLSAAVGALGGGLVVGTYGYPTVGALAMALACVPLGFAFLSKGERGK